MNDKSNILGSLMGPKAGNNKENEGENHRDDSGRGSRCNGTMSRLIQQTSGLQNSNKQHKLKQRFTVIRKLGKGTYGKVQLAINKETGQEVAIKTIKKTKIENEQDLQRVRREIQIMSSIEHPHIIHIYEVFENKDKIVLVMQYAPGGELYEYVSQSKLLDDSEARRLFRQIATAIYYCHQNKICHRDLKLENILLDEKNNAKLADFGLSNVFDKSHQLKTFCGSPLYASPEIVQGSPYEGPEVDCWSLGVLLYTLVYGAMPFDGSNFKRLVKQISESCYFEPKQKSQASPLIRKLLCADPIERAKILDICTDPWVNGISVTPLASNGGLQAQQTPAHQSLLKVAQDMANLTPVRFDILLALTPGNSKQATEEAASEQNLAARPPLARLDPHKRRPSASSDTASKRSIEALDPSSIMDLEEVRATSPVASYIVRDLVAEEEKPTMMSDSDVQLETDVTVLLEPEIPDEVQVQSIYEIDQDDSHLKEEIREERLIPELPEPAIEVEIQQEQQNNETQIELAVGLAAAAAAADNNNEDHHSMREDELVASALDTKQQAEQLEEDSKEDIEPANSTIELASTGVENSLSQAKVTQTTDHGEEEAKMDVDVQRELEPEAEVAVPSEASVPSDDKKIQIIEDETHNKVTESATHQSEAKVDERRASEDKPSEDKPKKAKKKIVVVKKRKKRVSNKESEDIVAKDEPGAKTRTGDKDSGLDVHALDSKRKDSLDTPKSEKAKASGPGKVRIPNTFQPQATPSAQPETPSVSGKGGEGRRQSSLVADVSQKLLQQSSAPAGSSMASLIKSDQPQLASVRVSDKKSEFERRASLAAISPTAAAAANNKPTVVVAPVVYQPELYQAELLHEPMEGELLTIVEPVEKLEPSEVGPVAVAPTCLQPPQQQNEDESESQTPTYQSRQAGSNLADVTQKLMDCASNRLGYEQQQQLEELLSPSSNDRSDSVETIKADGAASCSPVVLEAPSVRSQFSIRLGENTGGQPMELHEAPETPSASIRQRQVSTATGPAPITRSYKKVTFTKDGACITETGKIYSTKADDGTVRRIERKSKVTHYPAEGASSSSLSRIGAGEAASRSEEVEEEVYEEGEGVRGPAVWQENQSAFLGQQGFSINDGGGNQRGKHLERLIMPTSIGSGREEAPFGPLNQEFGFPSNDVNHHQARKPSFTGRERSHSRQLGRADSSCSSCSSGSTDVFDDIFDHWTGAISMFNQGHTMGSSHFRPFSGRTSTRAAHQAARRTPDSAGLLITGRPPARCESAEPQPGTGDGHQSGGHLHNRQRRHREWRSSGANTSGYESDAASERPASALGGGFARGSLSRLFPSMGPARRHVDQFFADTASLLDSHLEPGGGVSDLGRTIVQEHDSLRRRLAQQHKQLWKGSTPSLFSGHDDPVAYEPLVHPAPARYHQPATMDGIGQLFCGQGPQNKNWDGTASCSRPSSAGGWTHRPPRLPTKVGSTGSSSALHCQQPSGQEQQQQRPQSAAISHSQQQAQSWPRETLEQSQSSSSFLRSSIALDSAPTRRNDQTPGGNLPPRHEFQMMRRSTSKVSLLANKSIEEAVAAKQQHQHQHQHQHQQQQQQSIKHQASFIELKRTSSSNSAHQQQQQHMQQMQQMQHESTMATTSQRVISNSGSSSAFWETVATPTTPLSCGTQSGGGHLEEAAENRTLARDNLDSRVQSWLQESTGNMSTSSGSKSSVSEQSRQPETGQLQYRSVRMRPIEVNAGGTSTTRGSPVVSGTRGSPNTTQKDVSQSSTVIISSTSSSSANWASEQKQHQQDHHQLESSRSIISNGGQMQSSGANRQVTSRATFTLRQSMGQSPEVDGAESQRIVDQQQQQQQQVSSLQSSMTNVRRPASTMVAASAASTPPACQKVATEGPLWIHESSSRSIFGEELDESLSGGCSAELESRSSSSLLDQLRSRGYRSMINQRMVAQQTGVIEQPIEPQVTSSTTQVNRQEQASSSRVIISSSSTRVLQQHRQLITSTTTASSSRSGGGGAISSQKKAIVEQDEEELGTTHGQIKICNGLEEPHYASPEVPKENGDFCAEALMQHEAPGEAYQKYESSTDELNKERMVVNAPSLEEEKNNLDIDPLGKGVVVVEEEEEEEDVDGDVREVKASFKAQLDRVKETEMFLRSLHAEEAEADRKRQQLFLFNNLLLSTKLNGVNKSRPLNDEAQIGQSDTSTPSVTAHYTEARSAPIYMGVSSIGCTPFQVTNGFMASQPPPPTTKSYLLPDESDGYCFNTPSSGYASRKLQQQPLPSLSARSSNLDWSPASTMNGYDSPVQPIVYNSPINIRSQCNANEFISDSSSRNQGSRRSRSQLSDEFNGIGSNRRVGRPMSANLDSMGWMSSCVLQLCDSTQTTSTYFPSRARRSLSQIRQQSTNRLQSHASHPLNDCNSSSEYASPSRVTRRHWSGVAAGSMSELSTRPDPVSDGDGNDDDDDDDDDHGLGAYRVSAYVPKVVPHNNPARGGQSNSYRHGKKMATSDWSLNRQRTNEEAYGVDSLEVTKRGSNGDVEAKRKRRISLQEPEEASELRKNHEKMNDVSGTPSSSYQRRSSSSILPDNSGQGERSRLSELEQRMLENKRRREELLAGRTLAGPASENRHRTQSSKIEPPDSAKTKTVKLNARPSRLESMEARIKRRSYYVRTSPERSQIRSQQNVDKWRRPSEGSQHSSNRYTGSLSGSLVSSSTKLSTNSSLDEETTGPERLTKSSPQNKEQAHT